MSSFYFVAELCFDDVEHYADVGLDEFKRVVQFPDVFTDRLVPGCLKFRDCVRHGVGVCGVVIAVEVSRERQKPLFQTTGVRGGARRGIVVDDSSNHSAPVNRLPGDDFRVPL